MLKNGAVSLIKCIGYQARFESSGSSSQIRRPRAPFVTSIDRETRKTVTFDKNMPSYIKKKAWERDGQDKEKWFKRKHAHHHVLEKAGREKAADRYENIERKRRRERQEYTREREEVRDYKVGLKNMRSNTQIDYIFGTNSVLASLKGDKRYKFGKLFIHNPKDTHKANEIIALAREKDVNIIESTKQDLNILTNNAVHNGIVIETRPMEIPNIKSMGSSVSENSFNVKVITNLIGQSETENKVIDTYGKRYPLGLYLDEISDPHNVGAIVRSAYFLGVNFVVFSEKNCAPLSPVVSKASSGAIEFINLYKADKPLTFFDDSIDNGWTFVSTIAPTDARNKSKQINTEFISELLQKSPVILVIGSEGAGIRTNLINKSEYLVAVNNGRDMNECVDSLNVSVATALLVSKILS
ncbi:hypothetical protein C6P40_003149 [Pichia californica]|uniref:rRNA methyltransferase 1, mitochondrial n=1 Tax=Pichia californica TaxID=460514 RepID=A0A9P6WHM4_9ASCO|nr:hypothetical protein C6P42_003404 [[Candida] californica]KAG0686924.1 hypothetical protein C6P40_003149 [[Candida] californica]